MKRKILLTALAAVMSAAAMASPATINAAAMTLAPATAAADPVGLNPGWVCDDDKNTTCLNGNGDDYAYVYTKAQANVEAEDTQLTAADVCEGFPGDQVTDDCPFKVGSNMNSKYDTDYIVEISSSLDGDLTYAAYESHVEQQPGEGTNGTLWVLQSIDPTDPNNDLYYLINVADSNGGTPYFACSTGLNDTLLVTDTFQGTGECEWQLPPITFTPTS
jgi:hypothetical protein